MPVEETENYIRIRIKDPALFIDESFWTVWLSEAKGIKSIQGKLKSDPSVMTIQSYLFDKDKRTITEAQAWVKEHEKNYNEINKSYKTFEIVECKITKDEKGNIVIEGYANTKNKKDRYGDTPTVFAALRNYVYELADYLNNPVMLIDHENSIDHVAGSFVIVKEDEKGLYVKGIFSNSDFPLIKHARTVYLEGHAKAFSIGGWWYHEDKDNPNHLTYAVICDISIVGIGADPNALGSAYEKVLTSLEYVKALLPGLEQSQLQELKTKGLNLCTGKNCSQHIKEVLTRKDIFEFEKSINEIKQMVKKLTV